VVPHLSDITPNVLEALHAAAESNEFVKVIVAAQDNNGDALLRLAGLETHGAVVNAPVLVYSERAGDVYVKEGVWPSEDGLAEFLREVQEGALEAVAPTRENTEGTAGFELSAGGRNKDGNKKTWDGGMLAWWRDAREAGWRLMERLTAEGATRRRGGEL
jgi:hypothetical protein